jgi:hypothetical protein
MDEFDAQLFPPADHLIRPWLPLKGLVMIALARSGENVLRSRDCAIRAAGMPFLGWEVPEPQRVLYVDGEMDPAERRDKRLKQMRKSMPPEAQERLRENLFFLSHHAFPETGIPDLSDADKPGRKLVEEEAELTGAKLIISITLRLCTSGIENDAESWQSMQDWLLKPRRAATPGAAPSPRRKARQVGTQPATRHVEARRCSQHLHHASAGRGQGHIRVGVHEEPWVPPEDAFW